MSVAEVAISERPQVKHQARAWNLGEVRNDWTLEEIRSVMNQPFNDLIFKAQTVHRMFFDPNEVQVSTLCSIKTGGCAEDCAYCSQSARYDTGLEKERLMQVQEVVAQAKAAKEAGATRFCMGAAWRNPNDRDLPMVLDMIAEVKGLGMEVCATLGMINGEQAKALQSAGLDYYNHNLDTSEAYYPKVITTRSFQDRLDTLDYVRQVGMNVCSGAIIGMGEAPEDRAELLRTFANLPAHPDSVPINLLVAIEGTPLEHLKGQTDPIDFVRVIATARILMPKSYVRLSAGRMEMKDELQALCFLAGANSIFYGDRLLTTDNPEANRDKALFARLGLHFQR
jgi:biotin synthase